MAIKFDPKYNGMPRQSWVNNSFFPDLPALDFSKPADAFVSAGSAMVMMTELAPQRSPTPMRLPGGLGGGLGPRAPLSPHAGAVFTVLALAVTAREVYQTYTHAPSTVLNEIAEEPDLDELRRMLEEAERHHRELEKQTPAWYENPFSEDVTRHHAKLSELALWIERLKLEIELKEWEETRDVVRLHDPNASTAFEDRRIAELKQRITTHSTHSEKSLGALGGIVASAGGDDATPPAQASRADDTKSPAVDIPAMVLGKSLQMFDARMKQFQDEVAKRYKEKQGAEEVLKWVEETVIPELAHIQKTPASILRMPTLSTEALRIATEVQDKLAIVSKWKEVVAKNDVQAMADAMDAHLKALKLTLLTRIDRGEDAKSLSQWFESIALFEVNTMQTMALVIARTPEERQAIHDVNNRYTHFLPLMSLNLIKGRLDEARRACEYHGTSLMGMIADLKTQYAAIADIEFEGFPDIVFAPDVNTDRVWGILQNLVSNGGEHPQVKGTRTPIKFTIKITEDGARLVYRDLGAGMTAETVDRLMSGVRVHNGVIVNDDDPEARNHGFGSQNIRKYAQELGITYTIVSKEDVGTVVDLKLPKGAVEPDPASYIVANRDRLKELKALIDQMPVDRRLQVVGDLKEVGFKVTTELLKKLVEDPHTDHPELRARARLLHDRFEVLLNALYMDIPVTRETAPKMQENALQAEQLRQALKRLAEYIK